MADLATLQAELDALKTARRGGQHSVRYRGPNGEEEVVFKTDKDMAAAIAATESEIAALMDTPTVRTINIRSRGWT
jgi:hypothetical protein